MTPSPSYLARKLATLSAGEWRELLWAQWALLVAQATLRRQPVGELATPAIGAKDVNVARMPEARRLALAITRAARFGVFRPQCLARSIALSRLLSERGIQGALVRVGVRRADGQFLAHAWVELAGETLGDVDEHVESFIPLTNLDIHRRT